MKIYPAIDLKQGRCVRLEAGDMARATIFNEDPAAQAREFEKQGFTDLHIVDLDGAFAGVSKHGEVVKEIISATKLEIQLGGGLRDMAAIENWLAAGVARVILGTAALTNPELVEEACRAFPEQIIVGIDARGGRVAVEGWVETYDISVSELAQRFADCGVAAIIYTDIARDGLLKGINIEATRALAKKSGLPVIASGGLRDIDDIKTLLKYEQEGIAGVIAGRALYDGSLQASEALELVRSEK